MSVRAKFYGNCPECGNRWGPGTQIVAESGVWRHEECPDDGDDLVATHPVCTTCWLTHPEGACDRE